MHEHHQTPRRHEIVDPRTPPEPAPAPLKWALPAVLALIAALLLFEHRSHLGAILPWLILAACPLMHFFMHRGHGGHGNHHHNGKDGSP